MEVRRGLCLKKWKIESMLLVVGTRKQCAKLPNLFLNIGNSTIKSNKKHETLVFRFEPVQEEFLTQRGDLPTQKTKIATFNGVFSLTLVFICA